MIIFIKQKYDSLQESLRVEVNKIKSASNIAENF